VAATRTVGDIELCAVSDGICRMEQDFYVGLDFTRHQDLLAPDGRVHIPIGCFLVRTKGTTVLVDAGIGAVSTDWAEGGRLPAELRAVGVAPEDVDAVVCTHLHIDHIGWLVADGAPYFPRATVRFGSGDWRVFVTERDEQDRGRRTMEVLDAAGRLDPMSDGVVAVAPGLSAVHTPGHTPGHYGLVAASGTERAYILGDAVECPLQLSEPDFHALSDMDPALAARTREALWREVEGTPALVTGAHFPELAFGRVVAGEGKRYFQPAAGRTAP
jgi:glyoxylase-like metal-dependent hydrolase (beta-lactamase superfamily II)